MAPIRHLPQTLILVLLSSIPASLATGAIQICQNPGGPGPVSPSYELCIIENFATLSHQLDLPLAVCRSTRGQIEARYLGCLNENFRQIDRQIGTYSRYCDSPGTTNVTLHFESCLNQNFSAIDRVAN